MKCCGIQCFRRLPQCLIQSSLNSARGTLTQHHCFVADESLPQLSWCDCIAELKVKAPVILQLVSTLVSKNDNRNQQKRGDAHCMLMAILLKERNREMCGVQTLLSLILFSSCVQKQVSHNVCKTSVSMILLLYRSILGLITCASLSAIKPQCLL